MFIIFGVLLVSLAGGVSAASRGGSGESVSLSEEQICNKELDDKLDKDYFDGPIYDKTFEIKDGRFYIKLVIEKIAAEEEYVLPALPPQYKQITFLKGDYSKNLIEVKYENGELKISPVETEFYLGSEVKKVLDPYDYFILKESEAIIYTNKFMSAYQDLGYKVAEKPAAAVAQTPAQERAAQPEPQTGVSSPSDGFLQGIWNRLITWARSKIFTGR